jgi:hypothetical protein
MGKLSVEELKVMLENRKDGEMLDLSHCIIEDADLSGWKLDHINFNWADFRKVRFDGADFEESIVSNTFFPDCSLKNVNFRKADLQSALLRYCDLSGSDISGANLYCANLEHAKLDHIKYDDDTKYFRLYCPETGAFLGYKKCFNGRLVQLLIPADAKRTSATLRSCRCSKAKVLSIKSFDYKESYEEAWSLVDPEFVYRVGEYVEVKDFNEDRWMDSTTGIHFWMTREEAKAY